MSRLVFFTSLPEVGGHTTITLSLLRLFGELFDRVLVIVKEMPGHGTSAAALAELRASGVQTVVIEAETGIVRSLGRLARYVFSKDWHRPEVFLAMGMRHLSPALVCLLRPARSVYYHITHELSGSVCRMLTIYSGFFSEVIFISPATAELWAQRKKKSGVRTAVQPSEMAFAPGDPGAEPRAGGATVRFGFIGRLSEAKGSEVLARFAETMSTPCELHVAGAGPAAARFQELEKRSDRPVTTRFHGAFSGTDREAFLSRFFGAIDYLIVPSQDDREGIPTVILEALQVGVPVFATRCGGMTAFESPALRPPHAGCVTLVEKDRVAEKLTELARAGKNRPERGEECRAYFSAFFSNAVLKEQWQQVLAPTPTLPC